LPRYGRQIEDAIIRAVEKKLYEEGITEIRSKYLKTPKNKPVETLWDRLGYEMISKNGDDKSYGISLPNQSQSLLAVTWADSWNHIIK
jgi:predicted enzyme involved in methoxymalonyl-ACP biosynthesis